jgi:two-component system cell cycle sensor histidine kinase/response regulator CckA
VVVDVEDMLERLISEDVELVHSLQPGYRYVRADPAQLEQLVMNLVINAHQAMRDGGTLTITTETVKSDQIDPERALEGGVDTWVCLSVADTGIGMDESTLEHIFEPFFTTKPKGSGLGLPIARNIVEQYQGWIEVTSQINVGTTFRVYLPAFLADADAAEPPSVSLADFQGHGERILLVEDDEGVRAAVSEMLRSAGYEVWEAAHAGRALEILDESAGDLHLLFSDVVLPDRDGLQLAEWCQREVPGLPVLLTSGYTDPRSQRMLIRERGFRFLQKPFTLAELLPVVRQMLT